MAALIIIVVVTGKFSSVYCFAFGGRGRLDSIDSFTSLGTTMLWLWVIVVSRRTNGYAVE